MRLSQRLVDEVEKRTSQIIRSGMFSIYLPLMGWLCLLSCCSLGFSLFVLYCGCFSFPFIRYIFVCYRFPRNQRKGWEPAEQESA